MVGDDMSLRMLRLFIGFILAALFFLFACQLPGKIIQSIRGSGSLITSTPSAPISPTKSTSQADLASATPVMAFTATPEPAIPTAASAYPAGETQRTPIPSQTIGSSVPLTTLVVPSTPDLEATTSNTGTPTDGTQASLLGAYPGVEAGQATLPADNSYPGPAQLTVSGAEGSYPMPGSQATSAIPATPQMSASPTTTRLLQTSAATYTPIYVFSTTPSATQILLPTILSSPTATFFVPTLTPTPTRTPFLTPTPTITFTPSLTRTPMPVPPWVSVQLHATDPRTVQLAAGKPQLIEFFAFWSGPSLAMAPVVQGVEKEYTGRINFIYLDIDDPATDQFKQQLHYRMEPHFFLLDAKGKVLQQWVGYVTVEQFRQALDSALP
jgi:thiol-disulfide isomerase/thioredoxin